MKLVIDIPKEVYKCVMDGTYCGTLYEELKNGVPVETRGDCISREAAIDEIEWEEEYGRIDTGKAIEVLKRLPSVKPERKPGKWIRAIDPDVNAWTGGHTCSECGRACVQMSMNYCANCGAPMDVSDNAEKEDKT